MVILNALDEMEKPYFHLLLFLALPGLMIGRGFQKTAQYLVAVPFVRLSAAS
ncbi:hypothetical protein MAXJ12_13191 [Mesorhizobium alhagi CCNWXJ12-2]|uniref:Uncharacterized protein n=1 Tax=Mesorhizobium alhagi CCNWXJ12-2 TaxID=1107882 RepID=H0HR55_9HYPH|nr:hypothetical protein MAXJ12_13191 [Mesorhizobium alhagi CCNWXJ12-2]